MSSSPAEEGAAPFVGDGGQGPAADASRADGRVADVLYRTALAGDRRAAVISVLSAIFVTSLVQQQAPSEAAWVWCVACVLIAGARLFVNRPRLAGSAATSPL